MMCVVLIEDADDLVLVMCGVFVVYCLESIGFGRNLGDE